MKLPKSDRTARIAGGGSDDGMNHTGKRFGVGGRYMRANGGSVGEERAMGGGIGEMGGDDAPGRKRLDKKGPSVNINIITMPGGGAGPASAPPAMARPPAPLPPPKAPPMMPPGAGPMPPMGGPKPPMGPMPPMPPRSRGGRL